MQFSSAQTADLLRCTQRDDSFVEDMQDSVHLILRFFGLKTHSNTRKIVTNLTNTWYYFITSVNKLQTLGEEYTGILRFTGNQIPSKSQQILWLCLYLGGETLVDRLISLLKTQVRSNPNLTRQAKNVFGRILEGISENKENFRNIHRSLFYIDGKFYNISNRITGIKYVLLRKWIEDASFTNSFKFLGYLSLVYVLITCIQQNLTKKSDTVKDLSSSCVKIVQKYCILCSENRKNACTTLCGHVFCWECISDCLSYQENCPICREVVTPNRLIFLQNYC